MPIITSNIEEFTETRISVDANTYSLTLTNYSNIMLEVVKEEVSASITIPAYAIANISVSPNMHLIIRRQNIDPNALILTGMQIYYSQNSTKISDSIQPLSNLPAYIMKTEITAPVNIEGTIPITGDVIISDPVSIQGTVPVTGTVNVGAPITIDGTVGIAGTVSIAGITITNGTIPVSGDVNVTGDVNVVQGNVSVVNTPAVTVAAPVSIEGTVQVAGDVDVTGSAVTVASGNVSIVNTPAVTVDGSVSLEAGTTVNIASMPNVNIAGITVTNGNLPVTGNVTVNGSVTVASGNVSIVNTPAVTVDGSVSLEAGTTVNIASMPNVTLASGTVVNIGSMPNVTIAGTPTVNIGSGSITVNSGNINIANAPDVKVQSQPLMPGQGYGVPYEIFASYGVGGAYYAFMEKPALLWEVTPDLSKSALINAIAFTVSDDVPFDPQHLTIIVDLCVVTENGVVNLNTQASYTFDYTSGEFTKHYAMFYLKQAVLCNAIYVRVLPSNTSYAGTFKGNVYLSSIPDNRNLAIRGRQDYGVYSVNNFIFEKTYSTVANGITDLIYQVPNGYWLHLTYVQDGFDLSGTLSYMSIDFSTSSDVYKGRIMRQLSPVKNEFIERLLDIWLPEGTRIKSVVNCSVANARRLLYIWYELWNI